MKYKYANSESAYLTVATTRPETLFGDTGIGIHPSLENELISKSCVVPLINRTVPIILDKRIEKSFGTGIMKITPAHDKKDYQLALTHGLEIINILDKDNRLLKEFEVGKIKGRINNIRNIVVSELEDGGFLEKKEPYVCKEKECYRCNSGIEYSLTDQWYVKMKPLAEKLGGKTGELNFYPDYQKNVCDEWLENINDWCISRQIAWGHEIPAWYCSNCQKINVSDLDIVACLFCDGKALVKDKDVLDTWFSSWLWSYGVFNRNGVHQDYMKKYFPLDVIITGSDILFFWITKMMMASLEFKDKLPFKDIILHGIIRDKDGVKMTKSIGNVIDPLDISKIYGTDALRYTLLHVGSVYKDIKIDIKNFQIGKSLATKLWNAGRYILLKNSDLVNNLADDLADNLAENNSIRKALAGVHVNIKICINKYDFNGYCHLISSFFWNDF